MLLVRSCSRSPPPGSPAAPTSLPRHRLGGAHVRHQAHRLRGSPVGICRPLAVGEPELTAEMPDEGGRPPHGSCRPGLRQPGGSDNPIRAGHTACSYSWRMPPRRSRRRMSSRASWSVSVIGAGSWVKGRAFEIPRRAAASSGSASGRRIHAGPSAARWGAGSRSDGTRRRSGLPDFARSSVSRSNWALPPAGTTSRVYGRGIEFFSSVTLSRPVPAERAAHSGFTAVPGRIRSPG
jgi:hypothetical protein